MDYDAFLDFYRQRQDEIFLESLSRQMAWATSVGDLILPLPLLAWSGWCGF